MPLARTAPEMDAIGAIANYPKISGIATLRELKGSQGVYEEQGKYRITSGGMRYETVLARLRCDTLSCECWRLRHKTRDDLTENNAT